MLRPGQAQSTAEFQDRDKREFRLGARLSLPEGHTNNMVPVMPKIYALHWNPEWKANAQKMTTIIEGVIVCH
jgi:hypothetical protein